ncbi:transglycosylase SLT domain-containing protein [Phaeovibrio sulfidiphilus]|uniref:transglycosylase SLT domain-containing protein n=1 Tax=Phaeovibrio sulfidiphilus TaxID=1220600 RepID=UPI001F5555ED|nr:transglycosylase SLT domain-containing protein [Phaeovibrio sulfidiphilus]
MGRTAVGGRSLLYGFAFCGASLAVALPCAARTPPEAVCAAQTEHHNRQAGFPPHMLTAISLVESGRWNKSLGARIAWPWTVTTGNDGRFFDTREQALAHIAALRAKGVTNIDVGCMQVNLHFHGKAFRSIEEALDPASNVAYAVVFLNRLYGETRSWARSMTAYHSRTPVHAERYAGKLLSALDEVEESAPRRQALTRGIAPAPPRGRPSWTLKDTWQGYDAGVSADTLERYRTHTESRAREYMATYGGNGGLAPAPTGPIHLVPAPAPHEQPGNAPEAAPGNAPESRAPDTRLPAGAAPAAGSTPDWAAGRDRNREQLEKARQLDEEARVSREKAEQWRSRVLEDWYRRKQDASRSPSG